MNALLVSAKPRSVFLLLTQVLLAIHVTYHMRRFVMLHTHHMPDKQKSQVQVAYIHEKIAVCKPYSCLNALCLDNLTRQSVSRWNPTVSSVVRHYSV